MNDWVRHDSLALEGLYNIHADSRDYDFYRWTPGSIQVLNRCVIRDNFMDRIDMRTGEYKQPEKIESLRDLVRDCILKEIHGEYYRFYLEGYNHKFGGY